MTRQDAIEWVKSAAVKRQPNNLKKSAHALYKLRPVPDRKSAEKYLIDLMHVVRLPSHTDEIALIEAVEAYAEACIEERRAKMKCKTPYRRIK